MVVNVIIAFMDPFFALLGQSDDAFVKSAPILRLEIRVDVLFRELQGELLRLIILGQFVDITKVSGKMLLGPKQFAARLNTRSNARIVEHATPTFLLTMPFGFMPHPIALRAELTIAFVKCASIRLGMTLHMLLDLRA